MFTLLYLNFITSTYLPLLQKSPLFYTRVIFPQNIPLVTFPMSQRQPDNMVWYVPEDGCFPNSSAEFVAFDRSSKRPKKLNSPTMKGAKGRSPIFMGSKGSMLFPSSPSSLKDSEEISI